jgi:formamidopyrimidine-DNA glycosylase
MGLSRLLPGKGIVSVTHDWPKSFPNAAKDVQEFLVGASITCVRRRAKVLMVDLDSQYTLVIHLKMTGQLVFVSKNLANGKKPTAKDEVRFGAGHPNDSLVNELPDKSTRVIFELSDDSKLFFNDQRKFGWVKLIPTVEVPNIDFFKKVGPEPLSAEFTWQELRDRLQRRKNTNIKAAILDQTVVAGIGNIYADEALWGAKIHPTTLVKNLSDPQIKLLYQEARAVLQLSIDKGGSSNRNYVNAEGKRGSYMDFARVFRREKLPCPRCGTTIIKTKVAGRGTHTCPTCQVL